MAARITAMATIGARLPSAWIAGAACAEAQSLEEAEAAVNKCRQNLRTLGVAVSAGSLPETGEPTFTLGDDEIEIGLGAHGEVGVERAKLMPADVLTTKMIDHLVADLPYQAGDRVALLFNNLGATTQMELMIVARKAFQLLGELGIEVARCDIGAFFCSQEMAGFSISLLKLDDQLEHLLNAPCESITFTQG